MDDLDRLIDAVEAGCDHSEKWRPALGDCAYSGMTAFHGHLDAAKALHNALLPGWGWHLWSKAGSTVYADKDLYVDAFSDNPARSWLLAILKAYRQVRNG